MPRVRPRRFDIIRPLAEDRGIVLTAELDDNLPAVKADYARFKDVLLNLLSNAVKYNSDGGTVSVNCRPTASQSMRLSVADSGPGIPQERLSELFLPFSRLGAENSEIEGTGIGLTIVKRLIELMHGNIGVESTVGEGSLFWVELPLAPLEATETRESGEDDEAGTAPLASCVAVHTVLYIEDNPANRKLMQKLIARRPNCALIEAVNGETGLDLAASERPDLIIMDVNLPGIDGFEALRRLRLTEGGGEAPVIALSANAMPETVKQGLEAGFFAYLTKPVDVPALLSALDAALGDQA